MAAAAWSDLPEDILFLILRRLILVDYVRFGAVCSSWCSAARARRYPPAPQPPWLMFCGPEPSTASFLSLSPGGVGNKVHTLPLPVADLREQWIAGSSHGWLIIADRGCHYHLLNPITGARIGPLPPVSTFPDVEPVRDSSGTVTGFIFSPAHCPPCDYSPEEMRSFYFTKIFAVPGQAGFSRGDYTSVAIAHGDVISLAFARGGDDKWTSLLELYDAGFDDVLYHNGLLYAVALPGRVVAFDLSGPVPKAKGVSVDLRPGPPAEQFYLVESSGDILMVLRLRCQRDGAPSYTPRTTAVEVFKLDGEHGTWVEVKSLGSRALFLGWGDSVSLSTLDFPELKENCIYFTDDYRPILYVHPERVRDVGVYNLEDGSMTMELLNLYEIGLTWPPPVWITPHL